MNMELIPTLSTLSCLPQDIINDILYRLPAKTIGQCRCVSKAWLDFLTQPQFIKEHLKQNQKHPTQYLLLSTHTPSALLSVPLNNAHHLLPTLATPRKLNFPDKSDDNWGSVNASCDGLVLVSDKNKQWLINPITAAIREVPPPPSAPRSTCEINICLCTLGYDEVDDDYKIFGLTYYDNNYEYRNPALCIDMLLSTFSCKSGVWRRHKKSPYNYVHGMSPWTAVINGCVHWFANKKTSGDTSRVIAAYSLHDDKFYEVPLPKLDDGSVFPFLDPEDLGGCLCLLSSYSYADKAIHIWVMKEYGVEESWTKFIVADPEGPEFCIRPLCMMAEHPVMFAEKQILEGPDFSKCSYVFYDINEGTMEYFMVNCVPGRCCSNLTFIESLVSPNGYYHEAQL